MKDIIKYIWRMAYPFVIYVAVAYSVEIAFMLFFSVSFSVKEGMPIGEAELVNRINESSLYVTTAINTVLIPIYAVFLWMDKKKRIAAEGKKYKLPGISQWIELALFGMGAAIVVNFIVSLSGVAYLSPKYQEVSQAIYTGNVVMEIISAAVAAPVLEEFLFRGMVYGRLRERLRPVAAIIISAAVFGVFHGNLVQFVYAFLMGLVMAYLCEKYKTVWASVVFHFGANLISVIITELVSEKYMTVMNVLIVFAAALALTVILYKRVSRYEVREE